MSRLGPKIRCLAGRMAMHACQIGPTNTAPLAPGTKDIKSQIQKFPI